jgi:sterol desaturase/sphingolipid hydroxylase (fatty acid hydroxylase superfamily)
MRSRFGPFDRSDALMSPAIMWFLNVVLGDAFVIMCIMFLFVGTAEYFFPAQQISRRHYALNFRYAFLNVFILGALTPVLSLATAASLQQIGFGLIDLRALGFGGLGGSLFALLVGTLIWDFLQYWQHRLEHRSKILWQMHLLHHCDEHMNVTTGARHHALELVLAPVFVTIPTALLFKVPPVTIAVLSLLPYAWVYFTHANINLGFGPLWWLAVSPNYHRVHHSLTAEHIDKNFVNWFPIWDILFGTACAPRWRACPATGVAGVSVQSVAQALLLPFAGWRRMIAQRLVPPAPEAGLVEPPQG